MPPGRHPFPGFFAPDKSIRALAGHFRNGHTHPVFINAQDGTTDTVRGRTTRCSSPTTPPAERRAYAAREQARKAKGQSPTDDSSERSTSVHQEKCRNHSHRVHSRRDLEPDLPQTHRHSTKHLHRAPKQAESPRQRDSDAESNWSTSVHVPRPAGHPYQRHRHHHLYPHPHAVLPEHYVYKTPIKCHCVDCHRAAMRHVVATPQPVDATREGPGPKERSRERTPHAFQACPVPADFLVPCHCGFIHAEPVQEPVSRSSSPEKRRKARREQSPEPEKVRLRRHRHRRPRRHRHHTVESSSDTSSGDDDKDSSSESNVEALPEGRKLDYDMPNDWQFCSECCWGHPVFYILR